MTRVFQLTGNLTLLEREKRLVEQLRQLHDIRVDRLLKLKSLKDKEEQLCDVLSEKPYDVDVTAVPSTNQLAELQENVRRLECEKVRGADSTSYFSLSVVNVIIVFLCIF